MDIGNELNENDGNEDAGRRLQAAGAAITEETLNYGRTQQLIRISQLQTEPTEEDLRG